MNDPETSQPAMYAGLTGSETSFDEFDLGSGVFLRKTYAHLMLPFLMAFSRPEADGQAHPAPWKPGFDSRGIDVTAELEVPGTVGKDWNERLEIAKHIVGLLRLWAFPSVLFSVLSVTRFCESATAKSTFFMRIEPSERQLHYSSSVPNILTPELLEWVKLYWNSSWNLRKSNSQLQTALDVVSQAPFITNSNLTVASVWSAMEGLFCPSNTGATVFRLKYQAACYMRQDADSRAILVAEINKLYGKRSEAVHGRPKTDIPALVSSLEILRSAIIKMITEQHVPTEKELLRLLIE